MTLSASTPRARRVMAMFDFTQGRGLEIGPLDAALVPRDSADVSYCDVFPRDRLVEHYASHPLVRTDAIPEIDFPLWDGERVRRLDEAAKAGAPFDWIYASHVIEHVPDLIGWLQQIEALSSEDGALVLVVPDQRYTFDAHRPPTTVGQMLQAHDAGDATPSVRAVFDHHRSAISANADVLWRGDVPGYDALIHDLAFAVQQVETARSGEYVDCHVWMFTPQTFVEQVVDLRRLGLTTWHVEQVDDTPRDDLEFVAVLRRGQRATGAAETPYAAPEWVAARRAVVEVAARAEADLAEQQARVDRQRARLRRQRSELTRLRRVVKRQRRELRRIRRSRRWKVAGILGAPFDVVRRRRR